MELPEEGVVFLKGGGGEGGGDCWGGGGGGLITMTNGHYGYMTKNNIGNWEKGKFLVFATIFD